MRTPSSFFSRAGLAAFAGVLIVAPFLPSASAAGRVTETVAVYSKTSNGYKRTELANNTFKPEYFTFAPGGRLDGPMVDKSVDSLTFYQVAGVIAQSLKAENYLMTADPKKADLLIFLSWGTTTGTDREEYNRAMNTVSDAWRDSQNFAVIPGPIDSSGLNTNAALKEAAEGQLDGAYNLIAMANKERDRRNYQNADILGYTVAMRDAEFLRPYAPGSRDVISDVEENRYFVVLKAYDFGRLWKNHEKVLLWETRYSIRQFGNRFDTELSGMSRYAAQFFGQDLRLVRRAVPKGNVEVGVPTVVEPATAK